MEPMKTKLEAEPPPDARRLQGIPWWPPVLVIVLVALLLGWYFWSRAKDQELPVAEVAEPMIPEPVETREVAEATPEVWDLPGLSESDDFLRDVAARLSGHAEWLSWLATDDLVRRFVGGVDEIARGDLPASQARFLVPKRGFATGSGENGLYLSAESQARFNRPAAVVSGLDAESAAKLYTRLRPLFRDAYRELGYPKADFDAVLAKAIRKVLEAPDLTEPVELVPALRSYKFADPALEALPPVQKLMIRLGPANAGRVKAKLREIAVALDESQVAG